jgi:dTDP-4-dehydrorhamnose 3,5-epimerase
MEIFKKIETPIEGLILIQTKRYIDDRGYLFESWNDKEFSDLGITDEFKQDKVSNSRKGVLRGLHFQTKNSQAKFVRVLNGKVFDVAVDLRKNSTTFGKYFSIELSEENGLGLYIPQEFAHGFLTITENTLFLYKTSDYYYPEYDKGIRWNDPYFNINWPLKSIGSDFHLSEKDKKLPYFSELHY